MRRDAAHPPDEIDPALAAEAAALDPLEPDELVAEIAPLAPGAGDAGIGAIRSGKLAGMTMWKAIAVVALPVLLHQFLQAFVGLVDKLLTGHLPDAIAQSAFDGVGIGTFVGWFVNIALMGLGVGGQAIIARAMGGGHRAEGANALGQSMTLAVLLGAIVGILMWFLAVPLAQASSLNPEATRFCAIYVRTISVSMPFCGVMMIGTMCLQGAGESAKPFYIAIVVNVVNMVAAWLISGVTLTFGTTTIANPSHLDPLEWGVFGIAVGATIAYVVGGTATLLVLVRGVKDLRLQRVHLNPDWPMIWRIVRVGIPSFFEGLAMWGVQFFVMMIIGHASKSSNVEGGLVGAHTIAVQWEAFSFLPGFAMGTAAGAVAGQYLGAGSPRMARRAIWACTYVGVAIMGSLGILFMTSGHLLTRLISRVESHLEVVPQVLFICGIVQVFFALAMVVRNGLRGVGDTTWILVITMGSCFLIRLPAAYIFGVVLGWGLPGIWMALCGELVIRGLLFLARFVWGKWEKLKI